MSDELEQQTTEQEAPEVVDTSDAPENDLSFLGKPDEVDDLDIPADAAAYALSTEESTDTDERLVNSFRDFSSANRLNQGDFKAIIAYQKTFVSGGGELSAKAVGDFKTFCAGRKIPPAVADQLVEFQRSASTREQATFDELRARVGSDKKAKSILRAMANPHYLSRSNPTEHRKAMAAYMAACQS